MICFKVQWACYTHVTVHLRHFRWNLLHVTACYTLFLFKYEYNLILTPFCMIFFFSTKVACFDVFYYADKGSEIFLWKIRCIIHYLPNFRLHHKWYLLRIRIEKQKIIIIITFIESYKRYKNCFCFIRQMHYKQG